jgi:hypothetical protein
MVNRTRVLLTTGALLAATPGAGAQDRPSFAGQWTAVAPVSEPGARGGRGAVRGDMGSGWANTITITQDAARLTVQYAFFARGDMQPPTRVVYALDGSESANDVMRGRGIQTERSRAKWDGARLVITTTYTFANPATNAPETGTTTRTLSLDESGALVVEVVRHGVLGGADTTTRTTYRKAGLQARAAA